MSDDKIRVAKSQVFLYFHKVDIIKSLVPMLAKDLTPEILQFSNAVNINIEATSQLLEGVLGPWSIM